MLYIVAAESTSWRHTWGSQDVWGEEMEKKDALNSQIAPSPPHGLKSVFIDNNWKIWWLEKNKLSKNQHIWNEDALKLMVIFSIFIVVAAGC